MTERIICLDLSEISKKRIDEINLELLKYEIESNRADVHSYIDKGNEEYNRFINNIYELLERTDLPKVNIPNFSTLFNFKLNELANEFRKHDMNIYGDIDVIGTRKDGSKLFGLRPYNLGGLFLNDMINIFVKCSESYDNYRNKLAELLDPKVAIVDKRANHYDKHRILFALRIIFNPKPIDLQMHFTKEEKDVITSYYNEYMKYYTEMEHYDFKERACNVINYQVITRWRKTHGSDLILDANGIKKMIEVLEPQLKAFGLESIIPEIRNTVTAEVEKGLYPKDEGNKYIPEQYDSPKENDDLIEFDGGSQFDYEGVLLSGEQIIQILNDSYAEAKKQGKIK